jgi:hypothetical protein
LSVKRNGQRTNPLRLWTCRYQATFLSRWKAVFLFKLFTIKQIN